MSTFTIRVSTPAPLTARVAPSPSPSLLWRHALPALLLLLAWMLFLYRETATAMVTIWSRSETFTHGFLVPPLVLWLIWRQRAHLRLQTPQPTPVALLLLAGTALVWLVGALALANAVTQFALVALLVLAVPAVLGWPVAQLILFPLGFLFFAVPLGEFLLPSLMLWTADVTVWALRLSGIPVYREGLEFVIPSGHWSVVEACSGVRYLIASLTVGTLFAYLNYRSYTRRLLFVLVAIAVPILANWVRAYLIVMLGHWSGNTLAVGVDHLIYGWVFFGVVILLMFLIGARWAQPPVPLAPPAVSRSRRALAPAPGPAVLWRVWACGVVLVAFPHLAQWALQRSARAPEVTLSAPDALAARWQAAPPAVPLLVPGFVHTSAHINRSYVRDGRRVGLYLGYYRGQDPTRKLVSAHHGLLARPQSPWSRLDSGHLRLPEVTPPLAVRTTTLRRTGVAPPAEGARLLVWQLYWINGSVTTSDLLAKLYGAWHQLLGRGDDAAVLVLYSAESPHGDTGALLASFLRANYEVINELLRQTRDSS